MSQPTPTLTVERAEEIIRQLTDGLVNIKDETGQFLLKRALRVLAGGRQQTADSRQQTGRQEHLADSS